MSRTLNHEIVSSIASGQFRYCDLIEIQWDADDGGTDYLTNAQQDISYGGNTYTANAFFLGMADVQESSALNTGELNLTLGGSDQTYISLILGGASYIDRKVLIQRLFIPDDFIGTSISSPITSLTYIDDFVTGGPTTLELQADLILPGPMDTGTRLELGLDTGDQADPVAVTLYSGRIMGYGIMENDDSTLVTLKIANHWSDFERINGRRTNDTDQKRFFPSDDGFEFCAKMREQDITWGRGID